ncbi:hypothetical protein Tco_0793283 [Tanacetum coccineum]
MVNGERQIQALVDKKKVIISETSIRSDLKFDDAEGIDCLPTATFFAELERMGLHPGMNLIALSSAVICLATNQKFNLSKYIFNNMVKNLDGGVKFLIYPRFVQVFLDKQVEGMFKHKGVYVTPSHTKKVFAKMKRPCKGFFGRVTPLFSRMMVQATEDMGEDSTAPSDSHSTPIISQPSSSKPQKKKSRRKQRKYSGPTEPVTDEAYVSTPSYDPPQSGEDKVTLVDETQEINDDNLMFDTGVLEEQEKNDAEKEVSAANPVTTAGEVVTTANVEKKDQIAMDEEVARNLEAQLQAELEVEDRISRLKEEKANIALLESWDNTQAMMDADFQLAQQMQTEEQEQLSIEEKSKLFIELLEK